VPAGLNLGSTGHREIAVAILAELVQLRAAGGGGGAPPAPGPSAAAGQATTTGRPADSSPATATDPVCGMSVPIGPGTRTSRRDGETYYFCSAGCQQAFEKRLLTHE
jgi:xanthine dehydrogenase accessory factor